MQEEVTKAEMYPAVRVMLGIMQWHRQANSTKSWQGEIDKASNLTANVQDERDWKLVSAWSRWRSLSRLSLQSS